MFKGGRGVGGEVMCDDSSRDGVAREDGDGRLLLYMVHLDGEKTQRERSPSCRARPQEQPLSRLLSSTPSSFSRKNNQTGSTCIPSFHLHASHYYPENI